MYLPLFFIFLPCQGKKLSHIFSIIIAVQHYSTKPNFTSIHNSSLPIRFLIVIDPDLIETFLGTIRVCPDIVNSEMELLCAMRGKVGKDVKCQL